MPPPMPVLASLYAGFCTVLAASDAEEAVGFLLEIGGENAFIHGLTDFVDAPVAASVEFVAGMQFAVKYGAVHVDELAFAVAVETVGHDVFGHEAADAKFLAGLAAQRVLHLLVVIHMATDGGVPFARLYVLPVGTPLQIELPSTVVDMEVHHRVEEMRPVVALRARRLTRHFAPVIDHGKHFIAIILVHVAKLQFLSNITILLYH